MLDLPTEPFPPRSGPHRGLLARELARQSLQLAAREELGAITRDAAMRESPGELTGYTLAQTFELAWIVYPGKAAKATLFVVAGDAKRSVWELEIPLPDADVLEYSRLAAGLEEAASGRLAEVLSAETKAASVPRRSSNTKCPPEVEAGLMSVNYFDLYAAVRRLHAANRAEGETPLLLADLARGYALLGLLTEHLDIATHKAFKASSLLYSHRAIVRNAPTGRWVLAFASCLAGLHKQALDQAKAAGDPMPAWARIIEPACRFDYMTLKALPAVRIQPDQQPRPQPEPKTKSRPSLSAMYRFWDSRFDEHVYTYGDGEPAEWRRDPAFSREAVVGFSSTSSLSDTVRLYRAHSRDRRHYFYLTKPAGASDIQRIATFEMHVWCTSGPNPETAGFRPTRASSRTTRTRTSPPTCKK